MDGLIVGKFVVGWLNEIHSKRPKAYYLVNRVTSSLQIASEVHLACPLNNQMAEHLTPQMAILAAYLEAHAMVTLMFFR